MSRRERIVVNLADRKAMMELSKQLYGTGVRLDVDQVEKNRPDRESGTASAREVDKAPTETT